MFKNKLFDPLRKMFSPILAFIMKLKLEKKPIYKYKMMEKFTAVNVHNVVLNGASSCFGKIRLIAQTEEYLFYGFTPKLLRYLSNEYVLRKSVKKPNEVVYFGKSYKNSCIFENKLFQFEDKLNVWQNIALCKDIHTGETNEYSWFRPAKLTNGHFSNHDYINKFFIDGDKLVFDVGRYNGNFENQDPTYSFKTDYFLIVEKDGDEFKTVMKELDSTTD